MSDPDYRETFDLIMNEADEMIDEYKKWLDQKNTLSNGRLKQNQKKI